MEAVRFLQDELSGEFSSLNILFLLFNPLFSSLIGVVLEFPGVRNDLMEGVCFLPVLGVTAGHLLGVDISFIGFSSISLLSSSSSLAQRSSGGRTVVWWRQNWCLMSSLAVTRVGRTESEWWLQSRQVTSASDGPNLATGPPGLSLCQRRVASPKSASLTSPLRMSSRLAGLMSRCITRAAWSICSPDASWYSHTWMAASESGRRFSLRHLMRCCSVPPSAYSIKTQMAPWRWRGQRGERGERECV